MKWITINEFTNYEVNEIGQIRNKKTNKILSQSLCNKGYYKVNIANKSRRVHRLLAIAFIPNPDNLETVNHINGNKMDNSLINLEWMSRADNVKHSREVLGLVPIPYSKSDKKHHLLGKTGENSARGKSITAEFKDGTIIIYGSAYQAAAQLFGNKELGKSISQSIKRNSNSYRDIKFKNYEESN